MSGEKAIVEGADALEDCRELFLWSLAERDADDLDELLPADEVTEIADVLYQLFTWVHIKALQADLEGLAVDAFFQHFLQ